VLWEFIPLLPAVIILVIAALSLIFLIFCPPKTGNGSGLCVIYLIGLQREPPWVWVILGGGILLIFINPEGSKRQVREFIGEARKFFKKIKALDF